MEQLIIQLLEGVLTDEFGYSIPLTVIPNKTQWRITDNDIFQNIFDNVYPDRLKSINNKWKIAPATARTFTGTLTFSISEDDN